MHGRVALPPEEKQMECPDCNQAMLDDTSARASEHKERARKLREIANVAQSRSEQARLNSRAELFDGLALVIALNGRASPVIAFRSSATSL
jgi:hypothetical protein